MPDDTPDQSEELVVDGNSNFVTSQDRADYNLAELQGQIAEMKDHREADFRSNIQWSNDLVRQDMDTGKGHADIAFEGFGGAVSPIAPQHRSLHTRPDFGGGGD